MADVIALPTAAAQPVVNRRRGGMPPRNVTTLGELTKRRSRRDAQPSVTGSAEHAVSGEWLRGRLDFLRSRLVYLVTEGTSGFTERDLERLYNETVGSIKATRHYGSLGDPRP